MMQPSKETEGHQNLTTGVADAESQTSDEEDIDFVFLMTGEGVQLAGQGNKGGSIPKTWILLDSQSTIDVFSNPCLVWNIQPSREQMWIHCTAGTTTTNLVADLLGYGTIWFTKMASPIYCCWQASKQSIE